MNSKKHIQRRKRPFQRSGLIFYCYLLIPLNELARNVLNINKLKIIKKIIDIINRSIQFAQNGFSCHIDGRRYLIASWLRMLKSDLSQARDDNYFKENSLFSPEPSGACIFPGTACLSRLIRGYISMN